MHADMDSLGVYGMIVMLAVLVIVAVLYSRYDKARRRKKEWRRIKEAYGKKLKREEPDPEQREKTALWYELEKNNISDDELVDDITWNDLEMDRVFDRINATQSYAGEQVLYCELHRLPREKDILKKREQTIRFFDEHEMCREKTQFLLRKLAKKTVNYYIPSYIDLLEVQEFPLVRVCKALLCTLVLLIVGALATKSPYLVFAAVLNFVVNIAFYALNKSANEVYMQTLCGIVYTVKTAKTLVSSETGDWLGVKENIRNLDKISKMVSAMVDKQQAGASGEAFSVLFDYVLGAFMWDFILYDRLLRQLRGQKEDFLKIYRYVGETDMCISIASWRRSMEDYCIPKIGGRALLAEGLYHPLLSEAVRNDFSMEKNVILTGSNASGKSTFIKAAAVNIILGQSAHTCAAVAMTIPDALVLTSMAVRDDILAGESYYIREIRYLKRMIEKSCKERMTFCAVDEILRGTNTMERIAASIAILNYLGTANCLLMVASHDLELAKTMEKKYDNYYFCESVRDGDVVFDYRLRRGICDSRNAIRLLEAVGFPQEIVKEAKERTEDDDTKRLEDR
ncbi:MAG: hypothetical protein Q4C50_05830 [Eubacteriales bacterium]|nr:hypothetical protein [Eubacteriales bacterium]